jgi:hypothetical protein
MQKKERTAPVHSSLLLLTRGFYHIYTANASFLFAFSPYFTSFLATFAPPKSPFLSVKKQKGSNANRFALARASFFLLAQKVASPPSTRKSAALSDSALFSL